MHQLAERLCKENRYLAHTVAREVTHKIPCKSTQEPTLQTYVTNKEWTSTLHLKRFCPCYESLSKFACSKLMNFKKCS